MTAGPMQQGPACSAPMYAPRFDTILNWIEERRDTHDPVDMVNRATAWAWAACAELRYAAIQATNDGDGATAAVLRYEADGWETLVLRLLDVSSGLRMLRPR